MDIVQNLNKIQESIPDHVTLVAVSKTKPSSMILDLHRAGHFDFGENKVQDLVRKYESLPSDIEWHMVGHMQTNKVKYLAPFVHLMHGVDSLKLLRVINKEAGKSGRVLNVLLQMHIATEDTKFGFSEEEVMAILDSSDFHQMKNIKILGVMGMATYTSNLEQIRKEFKGLYNFFENLKTNYFNMDQDFKEISMGMSSDYKIAIEEGSTMIRIGSMIFGNRN